MESRAGSQATAAALLALVYAAGRCQQCAVWERSPLLGPLDFGRLFDRYRENDLVLLDIKINSEPVEPLAAIVHRDNAYYVSPQGSWDRAT